MASRLYDHQYMNVHAPDRELYITALGISDSERTLYSHTVIHEPSEHVMLDSYLSNELDKE